MGYFVANNSMLEKRSRQFIGSGYADNKVALLSSLGWIGGWPCILLSAYFVSSSYGSGILEGFYFILSTLGGSLLAGFLITTSLRYIFSPFTAFINAGLTFYIYHATT